MIGFDDDFKFVYKPSLSFEMADKLILCSKQLLKQNEQLKRQLLVEQTIAECMAKLRRKGK